MNAQQLERARELVSNPANYTAWNSGQDEYGNRYSVLVVKTQPDPVQPAIVVALISGAVAREALSRAR